MYFELFIVACYYLLRYSCFIAFCICVYQTSRLGGNFVLCVLACLFIIRNSVLLVSVHHICLSWACSKKDISLLTYNFLLPMVPC